MRKAKLSLDEQIRHMKDQKGIKFNIISEEEARSILANNNYYFRIKSYAKNYTNYNGAYVNLEFAYLYELSVLDMHLRKVLLRMTLDTEHFLKAQLMRDFTNNKNEDGYQIIDEFWRFYPKIHENTIKPKNGSFCRDLIDKYKDDFALWNVIEVLPFGDFIMLYDLYYKNYPSPDCMTDYLWSARVLRNATAHNNCLLNSLKRPYTRKITIN